MLFFLWLLIGVLSRILPHLPNMTAITSLSLLSGSRFSKLQSTAFIILTLALSDTLLTYLLNYPLFGWWSLFNYSGFIAISLLGSKLQPKANFRLFGFLISASLAFWLWTNFGTWLCNDLYPKTLNGLLTCYIAALPFLRNAVLGDIAWMIVLLGALKLSTFSIKSRRNLLKTKMYS